jgi:hypothetical protein
MIALVVAVVSAPVHARRLVYSFERTTGQTSTVVSAQPIHPVDTVAGRASQRYVSSGDSVPTNPSDAVENSSGGALLNVQRGAPVSDYEKGRTSGTIRVDVVRRLADGGLVVSASERSDGHSTAPATCIVYGNTTVQCDSTKQVTPEEFALLRYLGPGFVNPAQMDAQRHWQLVQKNAGTVSTANYTVTKVAGTQLTIAGTTAIVASGGSPATITSTIGYDFDRALPTSITETVAQTQDNGLAGRVSASATTVLQLVSDTAQTP